jgi:HEPN domain-containing protein
MATLVEHVPAHLLDELVEGSWLPIVGAGLSRNAVITGGKPPVSWPELGTELQSDVDGTDESTGTLEIISAYEQAFGRVALIDRASSLIRVHDAQPGPVHNAFASIGFDTVITTNFDFLLERAYDKSGKGCLPVVDEAQLSTPNRYSGPRLIKFHGDINHPGRMVITENDYDGFLQAYPLLITSVTAMLVEKTGILIGYSLDDPDTRQILALIKRRLGQLSRPLWTIQVGAPAHVISRYERRGVKVINLPSRRGKNVGETLEEFFRELAQYWQDNLPDRSVSTDDRVTADFLVPDEPSRMCYFAIPAGLIGWYREYIFPEVEASGMVPVTARDVFSPPGAVSTKIDTLVIRASLVVAEIGDSSSDYEASLALARKGRNKVLIVTADTGISPQPSDPDSTILHRPTRFERNPEAFIDSFRQWISSASEAVGVDSAEPLRLLSHNEYAAALISAVSLLEVSLSESISNRVRDSPRAIPLRSMLREANERGMFESPQELTLVEQATFRRNEVIHTRTPLAGAEARRLVEAVLRFIERLR